MSLVCAVSLFLKRIPLKRFLWHDQSCFLLIWYLDLSCTVYSVLILKVSWDSGTFYSLEWSLWFIGYCSNLLAVLFSKESDHRVASEQGSGICRWPASQTDLSVLLGEKLTAIQQAVLDLERELVFIYHVGEAALETFWLNLPTMCSIKYLIYEWVFTWFISCWFDHLFDYCWILSVVFDLAKAQLVKPECSGWWQLHLENSNEKPLYFVSVTFGFHLRNSSLLVFCFPTVKKKKKKKFWLLNFLLINWLAGIETQYR